MIDRKETDVKVRSKIYEAVQVAFQTQNPRDWDEAGRLYQQIHDYETADICFWWAERLRSGHA